MWTVPRMWDGRTVAILASGPSMSQAVADAVRAAGAPTIAINTTWELAPWADMVYGADAPWWDGDSGRKAAALPCLKVTADLNGAPGVHQIRVSYGPPPDARAGFDPDPSAVRTGGNGGYQALHIAVHAGAARVLLCGYDMRGGHWHGKHPEPKLKNATPEQFVRWRACFDGVAPVYAAMGIDVVNCTPDSLLACFRSMTLEDALATCLERAAA